MLSSDIIIILHLYFVALRQVFMMLLLLWRYFWINPCTVLICIVASVILLFYCFLRIFQEDTVRRFKATSNKKSRHSPTIFFALLTKKIIM